MKSLRNIASVIVANEKLFEEFFYFCHQLIRVFKIAFPDDKSLPTHFSKFTQASAVTFPICYDLFLPVGNTRLRHFFFFANVTMPEASVKEDDLFLSWED